MELSLRYKEHSGAVAEAAFIRGGDAGLWLREISLWQIPHQQLACYIVPEDLQSRSAAGLLVVFGNKTAPAKQELSVLYQRVGAGCYIPLDAELYPEPAAEELKQLLLYEVSLFHPSIGLIGYEVEDRLTVTALLQWKTPLPNNWEDPLPFRPAFPPLIRIGLVRQDPEQVLDDMKEDIGSEPLDKLLEKDNTPTSPIGKIADSVSLLGLKGALAATNGVSKLLARLFGRTLTVSPGNNNSAGNNTWYTGTSSDAEAGEGKGLFKRFQDWMNRKIADLEKKRESELQRLLDMFENDLEEALRHAIPLGSDYLDRGPAAQQGWKLQRGNLKFDLSALGGGKSADRWDIGNYEWTLRQKYQEAARQEIAAKNYKRAAYIYAHLLNDFHSAANTLKSAGMYREAAILYKEHVKNLAAAAECYELANLCHEAIDLHLEMGDHEKAGDLYQQIGQQEKANAHYETCVLKALDVRDYLEAARIQESKKDEQERALATLLEGWEQSHQQEQCLDRYLDRINENPATPLWPRLRQIYHEKTPRPRKNNFLNVLANFYDKMKEEEARTGSREIAYTIVGEQLEKGNASGLEQLKRFTPEDKLIGNDINRFTSHNHHRLKRPESETLTRFSLPRDIDWSYAIDLQGEFLAFGFREQELHAVRGNWNKYMESFAFPDLAIGPRDLNIIQNTEFSRQLYLFHGGSSRRQVLGTNQHFHKQSVLELPHWAPQHTLAAAFTGNNCISFLCQNQSEVALHHYSLKGGIIGITNCQFPDPERIGFAEPIVSQAMFFHNTQLYVASGQSLYRISTDGQVQEIDLGQSIYNITVSDTNNAFRFFIISDQGCSVCRLDASGKNVSMSPFAEGLRPYDLFYYPDNRLFLVEEGNVTLFHVGNDQAQVILSVETEEGVIAILNVDRHRFAVLERNGRMSIHKQDHPKMP